MGARRRSAAGFSRAAPDEAKIGGRLAHGAFTNTFGPDRLVRRAMNKGKGLKNCKPALVMSACLKVLAPLQTRPRCAGSPR